MAVTTYPGPESIHRHELDNGITVLVYENFAAESVVVEGLVRAGALGEDKEQAGLGSFTAEMLMRGTASRSFEEIYEEIESVGGTVSFGGGRHGTDFSGASLAEDVGLVLQLVADSLRHPTFPEDQLEAVRGEILTGLQIRANDTRRVAALTFRESLYNSHPYGQSVQGYPETIAALARQDLQGFHNSFYGPEGMIITFVGAIKSDDALARVESVLGDWPAASKRMPEAPAASRPSEMIRKTVFMEGKSQSDIVLGWPGPRRAAPDYLQASLANTILGVFGMMGRLGQNVREKQGLAYYAYSSLHGGLGPSPWIVSTGVAPEKVEAAVDSILHEVDRMLHEPVSEEELADSQAFRTGSLPVSLETNDGLASILTDMELFGLGMDYLQRLPEEINGITPADVQAVAKRYLSTDQIAIAVAGPNAGE